ncbi:MAG: hypothetical protein HZC38_11530 [Chloroflexi bacterium]|nr:hypothetical protein [Chloroflexota bacterium]
MTLLEQLRSKLLHHVVIDIVQDKNGLALIFDNGCALPMRCACCDKPMFTLDANAFLDCLSRARVADIVYREQSFVLKLSLPSERTIQYSLSVESARQLTHSRDISGL